MCGVIMWIKRVNDRINLIIENFPFKFHPKEKYCVFVRILLFANAFLTDVFHSVGLGRCPSP